MMRRVSETRAVVEMPGRENSVCRGPVTGEPGGPRRRAPGGGGRQCEMVLEEAESDHGHVSTRAGLYATLRRGCGRALKIRNDLGSTYR